MLRQLCLRQVDISGRVGWGGSGGKRCLLIVRAAVIYYLLWKQYFNSKLMTLSYGSDLRHLIMGKRGVKALLLNFVCRTVMRRKFQSFAWREFVVPSGMHTAVFSTLIYGRKGAFFPLLNVHCCAADFSLLNLLKGKSLGRSKPATNS